MPDDMLGLPDTILGFTLDQIDEATCYLTIAGMEKLKPCEWARDWMIKNGTQEVKPSLFMRWREREPDVWLSSGWWFGPRDGWPWCRDRDGCTEADYNRLVDADPATSEGCRVLTLYLKAYIMKYGRPGGPAV